MTRKERKFSLIRPFWLVTIVDVFIWISEVAFGKMFSNQIKEDGDFCLVDLCKALDSE